VTVGTVPGTSYPSDLTDDQWALLEPVFNAPGKCGHKHADDLRTVVDSMLYIAQTGCHWVCPYCRGSARRPFTAHAEFR
jgi:transposase